MIVNEFTRLANSEAPIFITIACVLFSIVFIFASLKSRMREIAVRCLLATLLISMVSLIIYGLFFQKEELHQYYRYEDYGEVEDLEIIGWEVIAIYENRKIVHIKKEQ